MLRSYLPNKSTSSRAAAEVAAIHPRFRRVGSEREGCANLSRMRSSSGPLFVALVLCFVGLCHGQGGPPPDQICTNDRLAQSELTCNPTYQPPKIPFAFVYNGARRMTTPGLNDCGPPTGDPGDCFECCYKEPPAPPPPRCLVINTQPVGDYRCANQGGWDEGVNKFMCWVFDQQGLAVPFLVCPF